MRKTDNANLDAELIQRFGHSPEDAIEDLMNRYADMVRFTVERYLKDPEDVKECVNDTFMEFYRTRERYDGTQSRLSTYLAAIAKNLAISRFRKNAARPTAELPEETADESDPIGDMERRADLEQAIGQLPPEDAELIRQKYYQGLTLQEIAGAEGLPYETVKKRHQRSLSKLRRLLLAGLALLLAAVLAACAYAVLRHFGVLPGYGMRVGFDGPVYLLEKESSVQGERWIYTMKTAVLLEDDLQIFVDVHFLDENGAWEQWSEMQEQYEVNGIARVTLTGDREPDPLHITTCGVEIRGSGDSCIVLEFIGAASELDGFSGAELTLSVFDAEIPFTLRSVALDSPEDYSYALSEQGGVLAIPSREDGVLSVELYPLNTGTYEVTPDLIWGAYRQGRIGDITVTGKDGEFMAGRMVYTPFSDRFSVWQFGAAEPGEYVLHIPYIYLQYDIPLDDMYELGLDLERCRWEDRPIELPFGTARIVSCQTGDLEVLPGDRGWKLVVQFDTELAVSEPPLRVVTGDKLISSPGSPLPSNCFELPVYMPEDREELAQARLCLSGTISLLWAHEFEIPFTVE